MKSQHCVIPGSVTILVVMATAASAQTYRPVTQTRTTAEASVRSFDELSSTIQQLDTVEVTDNNGHVVKGEVINLTNSAIDVIDRENVTRSINRASVQRIVWKDPVSDGAQKGSLIGAIPLLAFGLLVNAGCHNEGGDCLGIVLGLTGLGAAVGAGLGAAIDSSIREVVYDRKFGTPNTITRGPGPGISINVKPARASVGMTYGW